MSSIRKISEDPRLRPFLSSHFDAQNFIKTVIKDGRSEDCFNDVSKSVDEVNEEIKGYISQHKEDLMAGMQDVAQLAERYALLSSTSQKLHRNIDRLKREVTLSVFHLFVFSIFIDVSYQGFRISRSCETSNFGAGENSQNRNNFETIAAICACESPT